MPANPIRTPPDQCDPEKLREFQARVVKLRARVFQHDLSIPQLKERVAHAREKLAAAHRRQVSKN